MAPSQRMVLQHQMSGWWLQRAPPPSSAHHSVPAHIGQSSCTGYLTGPLHGHQQDRPPTPAYWSSKNCAHWSMSLRRLAKASPRMYACCTESPRLWANAASHTAQGVSVSSSAQVRKLARKP